MDISISQLCYIPKHRCLLTGKRLRRRPKERDEDLHEANQLVFLDKSGAHERICDRQYGRSQRGTKAIRKQPFRHSKKWSFLLALTINGYLACRVIHGSVNADIFCQFLEDEVLPQCKPGYTVIVMDNVKLHHRRRIIELCEAWDIWLKFLLPYSPYLNPIEESFSTIKAWIKRNRHQAVDFEDFGEFLTYAVSQVNIRREEVEGFFQHAGYR